MTTTVGASTSYPLTIPELSETADIQTAIKLISYGQSADPTNNADIEANSLAGYLLSKANLSAPTFTGTLSIAGQNSQYPTSLALAEATHATSRRTSIQLGLGWQIGQDSVGDGTKNFYIYQTSTQLNPFTISSTNNITIGATGYTTTFVGNVTIPTIISNTINATSATTTGASLYPNITTGTMAIGAGLTTGTLNIATASAGAKTINIGTSTGTVNFNSSINTPGIARPVGSALSLSTANGETAGNGAISITAGTNTTNGSGGSVSITAGSYTANGAAGNININAGGGPSTGSVNIQTAMGNTGDIYLGNAGSTTYVEGDLSLSTGISGIVYKAQPTPEGVSSAGTLTWTEVKSLIILSQPSGAINLNLPAASSNSSITTDGYSFDWSIVNKSSSNAVTVVAVATNTLDGTGLIPANSSGRFTTRRVSSTSYKTYRIA